MVIMATDGDERTARTSEPNSMQSKRAGKSPEPLRKSSAYLFEPPKTETHPTTTAFSTRLLLEGRIL
jgi:hypothetical protein